jgi:hypothetical protein
MAIAQNPFTKIVEDVMLEVRENSTEVNVKRKYQRRVNDIYARDLFSKHDFEFMSRIGTITIPAGYTTGTISVAIGGSAVTGVGTVWTAAMTGYKLRFFGNQDIYTFTRTGATTGTISPAFSGDTAISGGQYMIFQDTFSLAADYDRMVDPPGFYYDYYNARVSLLRKMTLDWYKLWSTVRSLFPMYYRPFGRSSDNLNWQVQFAPPILHNKFIYYEYIPTFADMKEYTTGSCATAAGSPIVTGTGTDFVNNVSAGEAFRMDSSPQDWYLVSSVTDATHLVLTANYPVTNLTSAAYTVSSVPQIPVSLQLAIFYGACSLSSQDQDNQNAAKNYLALYAAQIIAYKTIENKMKAGKQRMKVKDLYHRR